MKKLCQILKLSLFVVVMSVCMLACGSGSGQSAKKSLDDAKEAYALLASSADTVDIIGHGIVGAWGYAIDHSSHYDGTISGLADSCGLTFDEVQATYDSYCENMDDWLKANYKPGLWISDFSDVVNGLIKHGYATYFEKIEGDLASAKTLIQSVDQSESYYSDLVNYYTAISNYLEFCKSPSGNYQSVGTTINDYNTEMSTSKSKLSFYLE